MVLSTKTVATVQGTIFMTIGLLTVFFPRVVIVDSGLYPNISPEAYAALAPIFRTAGGILVFLGGVMRTVRPDASLRAALIFGNIMFTFVHVLTLANGESAASGMVSEYRAFNGAHDAFNRFIKVVFAVLNFIATPLAAAQKAD